jgi:choloylglycine hydrolase
MPVKTIGILLSLILLILSHDPAAACTNITGSRAGQVLVGQNWDWKNLNLYVWFEPPGKGTFGCFFYGLKVGYPSVGMNDQGLVISGSLSPRININEVVGKKTVGSALEAYRLNDFLYRRCATVGEVIEKIKQINFKFLETGHFLVSDRTGASVILEGDGKGNLVLLYRDRQVKIVPDRQTHQWVEKEPEPLPPHLEKNRDYQVITNFLHSQLSLSSRLGGYPCWRYDTAVKILDNSSEFSPRLFRDVLKNTHLEAEYPTKLSTVYDLKRGDVYLYYLHNFKTVIQFNLEEEFKKGTHSYDLRSLFNLRWHTLYLFCALVLLSAVFVHPIGYLVQRFKYGKSPFARKKRKKLALMALIAAGINSVLILILIHRYPYILSHQMELVKHNLYENFFNYHGKIFFGILVLSIAMLLFTVFAWHKKYWSALSRIHYSLVTVVSIAVIVIMI